MKSTPETIREARAALARYMEAERRRQQGKGRAQFATFAAGAISDVEDAAQHGPETTESPAQRAADYAKARNQNLRPQRQINDDENAREGRDSALAFLERRRRSVIRK